MTVSESTSAFQIFYDAPRAELTMSPSGAIVKLPLPWLAGQDGEQLGQPNARTRWDGDFLLSEDEHFFIGATLVDARHRLEAPVESAYRRLFSITRGWHLYRIWNYIPGINLQCEGLERYQQFNIGRWSAFESCYGHNLRSYMPAASAVGLQGDQVAIVFLAGRARPDYLENPSQIPAYHYPAEYGPKPPGFARGVIAMEHPWRHALLSGTASIEGHRSVGAGDLSRQFKVTRQNIGIMLERMRVAAAWQPDRWQEAGILKAHFKCYLRHADSLSRVRDWLLESCGDDSHFAFVQADICRSDLDLEIEGQALALSRQNGHDF